LTAALDWSRAADPARRVGRWVEFHAEIGSTNDRARELLERHDGDGVAVVADVQTAGRGRSGRRWESPPGRNLMVSVGVRPSLAAEDAWWLGAAAALAALDACSAEASLAIKWPNDVYHAPSGRKVGGILVETTLGGARVTTAVIGLGMNVNWRRGEMPPELAASATSLADVLEPELDRVAILGRYLGALDAELRELEAGRSPVERVRERSWLDGRPVEVLAGERRLRGRALGVAEDGALVVETAAGRERVTFGDVGRVRAEVAP
jgi:BirA family biotin operon repressor/biotin-[acetyl-CoA-carboxylase] ligase